MENIQQGFRIDLGYVWQKERVEDNKVYKEKVKRKASSKDLELTQATFGREKEWKKIKYTRKK